MTSHPTTWCVIPRRARMPPRRHWQLCNRHRSCAACTSAVDNWKQKAQRSSWNASRLKYALTCILQEQNEIVYHHENGEEIYPITQGMDVEAGEGDMLNWTCGICHESHAKVGAHRPVVFDCTHSVCAKCYSQPAFLQQRRCPYCRDVILKKALLLVFNTWLLTCHIDFHEILKNPTVPSRLREP
jgi:hypothetical protein